MMGDDKTAPLPAQEPPEPSAADETVVVSGHSADQTAMLPPASEASSPAWSGRAGVPPTPGVLRDSAPYAESYTEAEPLPPPNRTWWTPVLLGLLALALLGIVVVAAWLMSRDTAPDPVISPTPVPVESTPAVPPTTGAPTPQSPAPSPQPQLVELPPLTGLSQNEAVAELERLGLNYFFDYRPAPNPEGTVIETNPQAGQQVPLNSTVTLVISLGSGGSPSSSATPGDDD